MTLKFQNSLLLCSCILAGCSPQRVNSLLPAGLKQEKVVTLEAGNLKALFVGNDASGKVHRAGYNGIAELYHRNEASSIFVPEYAGFNLEHIFGGDSLVQLFEPRLHPMRLFRGNENEVLLYQEATPLSHVESLTTFRITEPDYIDIIFECIIHDMEFFRHGYAGLFWASYIHKPEDKKIYFSGVAEGKQNPSWIAAYSEQHGVNSTHRSLQDRNNLYFAENFNARLANHFSGFRYQYPYYYGRFGNMALAYFFDTDELIRFSQSPTGGGQDNPAWDFQYIIVSPKAEKKYSFRARMVYKEFVANLDLEREFEQWKGKAP